jgi:hypothetical protein
MAQNPAPGQPGNTTLMDLLAMAALTMRACQNARSPKVSAFRAYAIAEAMILERQKHSTG